ncbi:MAG: hypothetical protein JXB19_01140 [Bacteroidales bacterium]|nr:hypothetical protein [Bacteroidales bacterium]
MKLPAAKFILLVILTFKFYTNQAQNLFSELLEEQDEQLSSVEWNGYVRGSFFGGSEDYHFNTLFGELAVQGSWKHDRSLLYADFRIREGLQFDQQAFHLQLKEAYAGYYGNRLTLLLGNQIVKWGRTDGYNPTNNINPNDYFLMTAEQDDQIISNFMMRIQYRFTPAVELELLAVPFYKPSVYRYDLFDMGTGVSFAAADRPDATIDNSALAARLNFEFPKAGFSLSFFHGYDPFYGFFIRKMDLMQEIPEIIYQSGYYKKNVFGADIALPLGTWIIRGEAAVTATHDYENHMHIPFPDIYYVAGLEHDFGKIKTIFQYAGKFIPEFSELQKPVLHDPEDPLQVLAYAGENIFYESALFNRKIFNQQEKYHHALFVSFSRYFNYEVVRVELSAYYNLTSDEYMIRPSLNWSITDHLSFRTGVNFMHGEEGSVFYKAKELMNGVFLQFKVSF